MGNNSLGHAKWECTYHIAFAPKYWRQVIDKDIKADVGQILGTLCRRKSKQTSKPLIGAEQATRLFGCLDC